MERAGRIAGHLAASKASAGRPVNVVVTGAAGNIAYAIIFMIGQGRMLGAGTKINLRLLDIPPAEKKLQGVLMEVHDAAFDVLASVVATVDYREAFADADLCLLIGARPRGPGMERADLLRANGKIFEGQGKAINAYASRDVRVVVVGNPANTNALVAQTNAPDIDPRNFSALTRLDELRARGQIANRAGVHVSRVRNLIIWGNHSSTQYPDVSHAYIDGGNGKRTPVARAVNDDAWLHGAFLTTVQKRGAAIIKARGLSSAASAANATVDHVRTLFLGTAPGEIVSMAVTSDGSYGVPRGIIYSFPVTCAGGSYTIVQGLSIDAFSRGKMTATADELLSERAAALGGK